MTIRIERITAIPVRVPVSKQLISCLEFQHEPLNRGPSGGFDGVFFAEVPIFAVKVEGGGGPAGWCTTIRKTDTQTLTTEARRLIGLTPAELSPRRDNVESREYRGVQTAALDWACRAEGKPFHSLLGPVVRDRVPIAQWSGFHTPAGAAKVALRAKQKGITALKLKANEVTDAGGIAAAIVAVCGRDFELCIDPNGRWTFDQSLAHAHAMGEAGDRMYLEDPTSNKSIEQMARIRRETRCGIARTLIGTERMREYAEGDAIDVINLVGSWPQILAGAAEAQRLGLPLWSGSSIESGLSDMERVHIGATQPAASFPCELAASQVREHDLLISPIPMDVHGCAIVTDAPGLGVEVDLNAIEKYRFGEPVIIT